MSDMICWQKYRFENHTENVKTVCYRFLEFLNIEKNHRSKVNTIENIR